MRAIELIENSTLLTHRLKRLELGGNVKTTILENGERPADRAALFSIQFTEHLIHSTFEHHLVG